MIEIKGKFNKAIVYTNHIEEAAMGQIIELCNIDVFAGSKIRIMPDVHKGSGCVIGFTADLGDKVIPNIVGVDIGCGMLTVELGDIEINPEELDQVIRKYVPSGKNVHEGRQVKFPELEQLYCYRQLKDTKRIMRAIGTLGGGNHFIELNSGEFGKYLVIHSGSRNLGKQVAEYYQDLAIELCSGKEEMFNEQQALIKEYKSAGRRKEIQDKLKEIKLKYQNLKPYYPDGLCFLTGQYREQYLHDMKFCTEYAMLNRMTMVTSILKNLGLNPMNFNMFQTVHNYIHSQDNIVRKGSIAAYEGQKVLIPINMRDGSILAVGKGNPDWNYSAPHGAGRLFSRGAAKERISLEEFQKSMKGIWTSCVNESTIDESPMAYKSINDIMQYLNETVDVIDVIKPIYNYKASE